MTKPTFFEFWSELFLKPKVFFQKNLFDSKEKPAYFILAIIIFGIGNGIDRLDGRMTKFDLQGNFTALERVNNWPTYWIIAILGGILGSILLYFIGGWFYNVRLKWSKGTSDIKKSRYIYLYSGVVLYAVIIMITIILMFINPKPYDIEGSFNLWDQISLFLVFFFAFYSIYVSYSGVRTITDADKSRARLWFLILPIIFYALVYAVAIIGVFAYSYMNGQA